jgi:hypothetical protein
MDKFKRAMFKYQLVGVIIGALLLQLYHWGIFHEIHDKIEEVREKGFEPNQKNRW